MSVLIKEMKMPKDCPMCPLSHWNVLGQFTGCEIVGGKRYAMITDPEYAKSSTRPDWCPLVDVPTPHGRLIEVTERLENSLFSFVSETGIDEAPFISASDWIADNAPTVIEAEMGKADDK